MFRKVTLKPFTSASNVSPTSRSTDGIRQSNKAHRAGQTSKLSASFHVGSFLQRLHDLLPVEAPILDKNFSGVPPPNDHPRQMNPRYVAFMRVSIHRRSLGFRIELHPHAFHK